MRPEPPRVCPCARGPQPPRQPAIFLFFLFFNFVFYKNIFLFSKFTGIYPGRPAAGRPGPGRPAAGRQRGGRPPRPPGSGASGPGPPAAGRPALPPLYKGWLVPPPLTLKFQKPRKKREGGRGGVRERQSGEALSDFQAGDCR